MLARANRLMDITPLTHADLVAENQRLLKRVAELEARPAVLSAAQKVMFSSEALDGDLDLQQSTEGITKALLELFDCDRAWMLPPSDLGAEAWEGPIEFCRSEWPSAASSEQKHSAYPDHSRTLAAIEESEGPLIMNRVACMAADSALVDTHSIQSQIMTRLELGHGQPWILGMHQCSHERTWTAGDRELFEQVATELTGLLTSLLSHRDLAAREQSLKLALESSGDWAWDWNIETGAVVHSASLWKMLGYEPGEFEPHVDSWMKLIHPEDLPYIEEALDSHLGGEIEFFACEHRLRTEGAGWLWVLDRGRVVTRSPGGKPLRMTGTLTDISSLKRAEEMLRRERRLFTGGPCVIFRWVAIEGWPVEYASPNVANLFGHSAEEFMSGAVPYASTIHPDDLERIGAEVEAHRAAGNPHFEQEYRIVNASGEERWIYDFTIIHRDDEGVVTHFEGYVLDATDRRQAEAERRALEDQMKDAQRLESLGVLAGGIAHDFNNLLIGVLGHAELAMADTRRSSPAANNLRGIIVAANQAAGLTQQMLAYSGKGRFMLEHLDVNKVIEEMGRLLKVSISKTAVLQLELTADIPAVDADGSQLRQVIMNLITNAAEAVGDNEGVISIATGTISCDSDYLLSAFHAKDLPCGQYVYIEVTDTGEGMDRGTLSKIFDPFFTTKFTGRGLGLAAVQGIIRGHLGAICVNSIVGQGTTFKVLLPAVTQPAEPACEEEPRAALEGSGTILLVDDEETVRVVGAGMIESLGYTALVAESGAEALEIFEARKSEIDCVLLDLTMPSMNGGEVFRTLRAIKDDVRVILSSGYNEAEIVERFSGEGLAGFIHKPYGINALSAALEEVLS